MPKELADATRIYTRSVPASIVFFDQNRLHTGQAHVERGRTSVDTATHNYGVRKFSHSRTIVLMSTLTFDSADGSATMVGFIRARPL
jgi:hypothetical protein